VSLYVSDADIWIRIQRNHPPDIFLRFWSQLTTSVQNGEIRSPEEVQAELERGTDDLAERLGILDGLFVPLDDESGQAVERVLALAPDLTDLGFRTEPRRFLCNRPSCAQKRHRRH
jgi:Domain of unknown function (DUF4411)